MPCFSIFNRVARGVAQPNRVHTDTLFRVRENHKQLRPTCGSINRFVYSRGKHQKKHAAHPRFFFGLPAVLPLIPTHTEQDKGKKGNPTYKPTLFRFEAFSSPPQIKVN